MNRRHAGVSRLPAAHSSRTPSGRRNRDGLWLATLGSISPVSLLNNGNRDCPLHGRFNGISTGRAGPLFTEWSG